MVKFGKEKYFVTACGFEGKYAEWFSAQPHWLFARSFELTDH